MAPKKLPPTLSSRIGAAVAMGMALGAVYGVLCGFLLLAKSPPAHAPTLRLLDVIVGIYLAGGVIAGVIVGIVQPWITSVYHAIAVATVAVAPLCVGYAVIDHGFPGSWSQDLWIDVIAADLLVGIIAGTGVWRSYSTASSGP